MKTTCLAGQTCPSTLVTATIKWQLSFTVPESGHRLGPDITVHVPILPQEQEENTESSINAVVVMVEDMINHRRKQLKIWQSFMRV